MISKSRHYGGFFALVFQFQEPHSVITCYFSKTCGWRWNIFKRVYLLISGGIILIASVSFAIPRFGVKVEQKCNLCHIDPAGGGMRNAFGSQYFAMTELAVHKTALNDIEHFQTQISDILSLGADIRTQYFYDESSYLSTLFQMEGNLYANAQLDSRFSATLKKGIYNGFEVYGTGYILPMQGYFRVGKFQPTYGWKFADHTSFVREKMLWPPTSTDTGLEFGIYPQGISANVGFFNGSQGMLDDGKGKAVSSRVELRRNISGIGFGLGGSAFLNDTPLGDINMYGPFYYLNLASGRFIYLGEIDWLENKNPAVELTSFATTLKFSYMIVQGVWIDGHYDFYDPDVDMKTGDIARYGIGLNYFPYGFLEITPIFRYYKDSITDSDYIQFISEMHFFF